MSTLNRNLTVALLPLLMLILVACGGTELSPEAQIRDYLYKYQPVTGEEFVQWAKANMAQHSSRRVYRAIYNQGRTQADEGHPNAVAVLSYAARAWAEENNLNYNAGEWITMQQVAIGNLREGPSGELKLWTDE